MEILPKFWQNVTLTLSIFFVVFLLNKEFSTRFRADISVDGLDSDQSSNMEVNSVIFQK